MYYIISPKPLNFLCQFEMPIKDKYGNRDYEAFYNSPAGTEFLKLNPVRIRNVAQKVNVVECVTNDITWLSLCYNCPLYVYILKDKYFSITLKISMQMYTNFMLCHEMQNEQIKTGRYTHNRLEDDERYYRANLDELRSAISEGISNINMKICPITEFRLSLKEGFISI